MKKTIGYYMKGCVKQYAQFETLAEAQAFMKALSENPNCESYGLER